MDAGTSLRVTRTLSGNRGTVFVDQPAQLLQPPDKRTPGVAGGGTVETAVAAPAATGRTALFMRHGLSCAGRPMHQGLAEAAAIAAQCSRIPAT